MYFIGSKIILEQTYYLYVEPRVLSHFQTTTRISTSVNQNTRVACCKSQQYLHVTITSYTRYFNTPRINNTILVYDSLHSTNCWNISPQSHYNILQQQTSAIKMHILSKGNEPLQAITNILRTYLHHRVAATDRETSSPQSLHPCPTQNKQISLPLIIRTQSRRQNTSIATMPPL